MVINNNTNAFLIFRSSPVHIFGNSNSLHSYARPPLASSAPSPSRVHLRERRRVRVGKIPTLAFQQVHSFMKLTLFSWFFSLTNRPAVSQSPEFFPCLLLFLMMKTWPGHTHGPQLPGIASLKVPKVNLILITF